MVTTDQTPQDVTLEHADDSLLAHVPLTGAIPADTENITFLGAMTGYTRVPRGVECSSGAARLQVLVVAPQTLRVRVAPDGTFLARRPWSTDLAPEEWPQTAFTVREQADEIIVDTGLVAAHIQRDPLRVRFTDAAGHTFAADAQAHGAGWRTGDQSAFSFTTTSPHDQGAQNMVVCWKQRPAGEYYYGFGERTGLLEKGGARYTCWSTDTWNHSPATDAMYQAIAFFLAVRPDPAHRLAYGILFNNSYRSTFDMGHSDRESYRMEALDGQLDYYVIYGQQPADVLRGYADLTGYMPLPPRWALGYHQSRWGYMDAAQVREIAAGFREHAMPCDVIHLDIDYMHGYRDFTWHPERFPDPARLLADLRADGFRIVTIIDPGIKHEPGTAFFDEGAAGDHFLRDAQGQFGIGQVWPGLCVFPDFTRAATRAWWGEQHRALLDAGVAGIWNDMNEPATGNRDLPLDAPMGDDERPATLAEAHNLYGVLEARATYEGLRRLRPDERPFVLTRSGAAGVQRYSAVWTGDNASAWEHLEMALPQLCNLGLSGVAFCGTDIGGFWSNATPELFARWMQLGALSPFARGHTIMGSLPHEPWRFGPETEAIARRYLELRYRLLPYLYTLFYEAATTGAPVLRPLIYAYPDDVSVATLHDEALLGADLLLAPVYRPGVTHRHVYLPAGAWHDYWTGERFVGPAHILAAAPLDTLPLYAREGSILPSGPTLHYTDELPLDPLTLDVYLGPQSAAFADGAGASAATGLHYEDAGQGMAYQHGEYRQTRYEYAPLGQAATLRARTTGAYAPAPRRVQVVLHGVTAHAAQLNGQSVAHVERSNAPHGEPITTITLPSDPGDWTLAIRLAPES